MALPLTFVGIEVAKDWLDIWLEPLKRFERLANQPAGWAALIAHLHAPGSAWAARCRRRRNRVPYHDRIAGPRR
jgi:hypothetical protein